MALNRGMSTNNALCFLTVGLVMFGLPTLAPGFFPPHALFGTSPSALWLAFMGIVHGLLGIGFLFSNEVWPVVRPALEWPPRPAAPATQPGVILRPSILGANRNAPAASNEIAA
jgi:hypothetical protein